jgi:outer membrane protein assembly factor BamD (BamD/ComL family)
MSVLGIMSSSLFNLGVQSMQSRMQSARKEFQQLGQDLQSGNMSAAQSDFATLQQMQPQSSSSASTSSSSTQSTNPITLDFNQLATDLKAGNTTAAQQDYAKLQQDFQSQATQTQAHHHHHHHGGGSGSSDGSNQVSQLFSQLGQALQSGNLSTAQQAYASLQQDFQQDAQVNALPAQSGTSSVSLSA